ncbi:amino acid adenylation domain-containing protein [Streptomyces sp. NPDC018026]|uniref:amino acid adenylation domain-containing protein n=1 Tax=Streptomyces sp. NPDC018026 TaxID=3365031 RepID=UPI003793B57D
MRPAPATLTYATVATVAEEFRRQAALAPSTVAVEADDARYTYAELDAWADGLAQRMLAAGVGPEDIVGVALPRSPALVAALLAVPRVHAAYLPLAPDTPRQRVEYMLEDAAPALLLHDSDTRELAGHPAVRCSLELAARPPGDRATPVRCAGQVPHSTPVYVMYTSGSTGRPKGVVMGAGALGNLLRWHRESMAPGPGRRIAQYTATGFDISAQEIFSTLVTGATLVIPGEETRHDPARLARWLGHRRITDLFAPNLIVEAVCEAALAQGLALPDLAHVAQAGEQLTLSETVRTFFRLRPGRRLHNHYGPTETHAATFHVLPDDPADWPRHAPVGVPIRHTRVHLLDSALREVPDGSEGEVHVSGLALARGYHGRPDLTADAFLPCPFGEPGARMYRTGDIARRRSDGLLEYLGRTDQQVKIRGVRVELGEVDAAIRAHPDVRDVAVVARGEAGTRRLDCYLVAAGEAGDLVARVRSELARTLPAEMIPATFTPLPALPANSNGKVDRNALPPPGTGGSGPPETRTGAPEALVGLFAECLNVGGVTQDDDFFVLGGHSLSAARLVARIRAELGHEVTIADVFRNPTVRCLTEVLRSRESRLPAVVPVERGSFVPTAFAQERLWVLDQFTGPADLYNVPVAVSLRGALDTAALRAAVGDVLDRHEALRTIVDWEANALSQRVLPADQALCWEVVDGLKGSELEAAVRDAALRPFRLDEEVPLRAQLFGDGDREHVLLLLLHHIAVDGWSVKPLVKDLGFAYACRSAGLEPPWRPLPVQYADYAVWQRGLFGAEGPSTLCRRQEAYWLKALSGAPDVLPLATDHPRPQALSTSGARVDVLVGKGLHRAVRAAARRMGCTVFMLVHAALALVLRMRGAGDDIVIGATVAGRLDGALDDLVGLFVNTLALRVDLSGDPTPAETVSRVREADTAAFEAQEMPFDRVVEALNPQRSMAYNPVVQVMLAFQVGRPEIPRLPGLEAEARVLGLDVAKFDLTFELTEVDDTDFGPGGIVGHLEYATDLFERETALGMARDLSAVLRAMVEDPGRPISRPSTWPTTPDE